MIGHQGGSIAIFESESRQRRPRSLSRDLRFESKTVSTQPYENIRKLENDLAAAELDTVVGERRALLSGGERQRLCLARAMLRCPHLLVLDEATSAIDIEGEHAILERLLLATPRPTIVMIAHRLESLRHCQRILVFEGGKMVSNGDGNTFRALERARNYSARSL